jgi:hypothetical protein
MAHYPQSATGLAAVTYPVGPSGAGQQITSGALNTKGSYTQLVAALGATANSAVVVVTRLTTVAPVHHLIDLATGAAGAETDIVPNLLALMSTTATSHAGGWSVDLPLAVASGTRVAIRNQAASASQDAWVSVTLRAAGGTPGPTTYRNYGTNAGSSQGVSVDPGGTSNTKGSYAALSASTTGVTQVLIPILNIGASGTPGAAQWAVDVATGAAGAETVLLPDLRVSTAASAASTNARLTRQAFPSLTYIPAGTRLAARAACDITTATARQITVVALAATAPAETNGGGAGAVAVGYVG